MSAASPDLRAADTDTVLVPGAEHATIASLSRRRGRIRPVGRDRSGARARLVRPGRRGALGPVRGDLHADHEAAGRPDGGPHAHLDATRDDQVAGRRGHGDRRTDSPLPLDRTEDGHRAGQGRDHRRGPRGGATVQGARAARGPAGSAYRAGRVGAECRRGAGRPLSDRGRLPQDRQRIGGSDRERGTGVLPGPDARPELPGAGRGGNGGPSRRRGHGADHARQGGDRHGRPLHALHKHRRTLEERFAADPVEAKDSTDQRSEFRLLSVVTEDMAAAEVGDGEQSELVVE
jgi:hypothetical protein